MKPDDHKNPFGKVFGRRKAHPLRPAQQKRLEEDLPGVKVGLPGNGRVDPRTLFSSNMNEVWLEIGFGGGEHLVHQAARRPDIGFLGCEPFVNGVAKLLAAMAQEGCRNIRIHNDDARLLLESLADGSIKKVFLLYPDPWPKKRHNKRRFITPETLAQLHRIMSPGADFLVASDIADYVRWTLREVLSHGGFEWCAQVPDDWRRPFQDWHPTRYEKKALREGRKPAYLHFQKLKG